MSMLAQYDLHLRYLMFLQSCGVLDPGIYVPPMVAAYTESHRHYHDNTHITFMLDKLDSDLKAGTITLTDFELKCVTFAIWWHDFVYDPKDKDNELNSIKAWTYLVQQVSPVLDAYSLPVSNLIESTISHKLPDDLGDGDVASGTLSQRVTAYFLDLDLAILASASEVYQAYARNIRKEYIHYPVDAYRKGRAVVLKTFLNRSQIFLTSTIEGNIMADMETRARQNVSWEIESLENGKLPES